MASSGATIVINPLHSETLPPRDRPAVFSCWSIEERLALVDRIQSIFDGEITQERGAVGGKPLPTCALRAATNAYLEILRDEGSNPRHTGNQLMPSQTKAHLHSLASLAIIAEALYLGCLFRWLTRPVIIRGSRVVHTTGPEREEFGTLVQAAPASATGYFEHE